MVLVGKRGEWKCASVDNGAQCAIANGRGPMHRTLSAKIWGTKQVYFILPSKIHCNSHQSIGETLPPSLSTSLLPIVMNSVSCDGQEERFTQCDYGNIYNLGQCSHANDASVRCLRCKILKHILSVSHNWTQSTVPPAPVQSFSPYPMLDAISIQLFWFPPSQQPFSAPVTQYLANCYPQDSDDVRSEQTLQTTITMTRMKVKVWYACCVAADSSRGRGDWTCQTVNIPICTVLHVMLPI